MNSAGIGRSCGGESTFGKVGVLGDAGESSAVCAHAVYTLLTAAIASRRRTILAESGGYAALVAPMSPASNLTSPSPEGRLSSVDVYITSQCNRRCTYCFLPPEFFSSGARMNLHRFAGVVSWSQHEGVREITLLGGE